MARLLNFVVIYLLSRIDNTFAAYKCKRCGNLVGVAVIGYVTKAMHETDSCEQCFFGPVEG